MAINVEIEVGTSKALKSINDLEGAASELKNKLGGTEIGTAEFNRLADTLKKVQGELNNLGTSTENINKAEASIRSLQGATELVAGSIAAGVGSLALFGANSEKLGEIETKVQGAIAIALGVREAAEGAVLLVQQKKFIQEKALQAATKVSIAVQTAYNAVLAANPIALIVIAIAGFIAALVALKDRVQIVTEAFEFANKKFNEFIEFLGLGLSAEEKAAEASKKLAEAKEKQTQRELDLLKARGATEEEIYKKSRELAEAQLAQTKKGTDEYDDALNALKVLDASYTKSQADEAKKRQDEADKKAVEAAKKRQEEAKKILDEAKKLNKELSFENSQFGKNEFDQRRAEAKKTFDERIALLKQAGQSTVQAEQAFQNQLTQIQKDADAQRLELQNQINEATAVSQQQSYNLQLQQTTAFYDDLIAKAKAAGITTADLEVAKNAKLEEIRVAETERLAEINKQVKDALLTEDQAEIQAVRDKYDELIALAEKNGIDTAALRKKAAEEVLKTEQEQAKASLEIEKELQANRLGEINASIDSIQGQLAGAFQDSKELAIANTLVNAAQAAIGIFASSTSLPEPLATINRIAQLGVLAVSTVKSIQQIKSANPGGGTSAPSTPTGGTPPSTFTPPSIPQTGFFTPNAGVPQAGEEERVGGGNALPIRTYVLAGDVTNAQAAEQRLNQRRQL